MNLPRSRKSLRNVCWLIFPFLSVALLGNVSPIHSAEKSTVTAVDAGNLLEQEIEKDWLQRRDATTPISREEIQTVIDRAKKLCARIQDKADAKRLDPLLSDLKALEQKLIGIEEKDFVTKQQPRDLYLQACRLAREIAFCNSLVDIEKLLFIKRHAPEGVHHMCDQYYGCNAKPGGGLYVLENPFGENPTLKNLLQNSVVENGRLKGKKLHGGTFLSPDVSFDGKTILFAYSEAQGWEKFLGKEVYEWEPEYSYHIFKCNSDGSQLVQLTDGEWNDFDPCFLPGGRVVFISERRGGFLRCGRHCPVYTMFSMEPDGSDIICLSYHETHEWHPSVTNDGKLVYTRWDYIDRDSDIAHHPWTCYPDGRDPRSFHGNYPVVREERPWMELSIRAIPNSHKFVATAAPHHGHAFGSLILIDPNITDDNAKSQLTRLTPEVPFPEAEGGKKLIRQREVYGTAWPLSEDDFICTYDSKAKNHGIYLIDSFGNKELLYRDSTISSLSPIPLQARVKPPVIPEQTIQAARSKTKGEKQKPATVSVTNVYDADLPWPENTKIKSMRIIQVLPKTTAPPNVPRIGAARQTNARLVLGTVPVEEDGSVYFEAPVGKAIYFQTLDERGMAVHSMRSATYLHPGEQLSCHGCHEKKQNTPYATQKVPLAFKREPSKIQSDVDGSNPFNYVRLVQPVLDRHCVSCHTKKKALDLTGTIEGKHGWTRSYSNLAEKYGFYFHVFNGSIASGVHGGSRTTPGKFGAHASELLKYLDKTHHGVNLPEEDFHRLTLWLDCNSEFYGSYENTEEQSAGKIVHPTLN